MTPGQLFRCCICFLALISGTTAEATGSGGVNAPEQLGKPYLILISMDGFRRDYPTLFKTRAIDRLAAAGVRAEALLPVFPTLTFPNHYSIVTGLYPAHHGIVANVFRDTSTGNWFIYKQKNSVQDGSWYGGEPVWVSAEKAGMVTAAYFYVGTEVEIGGVRPSHWRAYDKNVSGEERVRQVLQWLGEPPATRPHFFTLYFDDVDASGHKYGPVSAKCGDAVTRVDGYIQLLLDGLAALPYGDQVSIVLVSDHGQSGYKPGSAPFIVSDHFDLSGISAVDGGTFAYLYFNEADHNRAVDLRDGINQSWHCGHAFLPPDAPADWRIDDNPRYPDVLVQADPGCAVFSTAEKMATTTVGAHGWPPEMAEMQGVFVAAGPDLPAGLEIGPVRAVDIYPLLMWLLGLEPGQDTDSNPAVFRNLLLSRQ